MKIYTKQIFGKELKKLVSKREDILNIAIWSHSVYLECSSETEADLLKLMLDLNAMEMGDQFFISYEMLNKIADDLILGKQINLNMPEYLEFPHQK